jgi:hypothetical protein
MFDELDLLQLPNYKIYLKLMIDGTPSKPFSATTLKPEIFASFAPAAKPQWEFPRLCRGGSKSLTYPAVDTAAPSTKLRIPQRSKPLT